MIARVKHLLVDEKAGEVVEYALITGLIIVAAIAVVGAVGVKALAHWNLDETVVVNQRRDKP